MKIYIDADACCVINETLDVSKLYNVETIIVCDDAHYIEYEGIKTIVVEKKRDSADYKILSLLKPNDICVTNDYGLSALALSKKARVIDFDGKIIYEYMITGMLEQRTHSAKMRKAKVRMKNIPKRDMNLNEVFKKNLINLLEGNNDY